MSKPRGCKVSSPPDRNFPMALSRCSNKLRRWEFEHLNSSSNLCNIYSCNFRLWLVWLVNICQSMLKVHPWYFHLKLLRTERRDEPSIFIPSVYRQLKIKLEGKWNLKTNRNGYSKRQRLRSLRLWRNLLRCWEIEGMISQNPLWLDHICKWRGWGWNQ